jgi:hypothetical protein
MSTSVRRICFALMHIRFLILVAALLVSTALTCQAGGTYRTGPMFVFPDYADTITAGTPSVPLPSMQNETAGDFVAAAEGDSAMTKHVAAADRRILGKVLGDGFASPRRSTP